MWTRVNRTLCNWIAAMALALGVACGVTGCETPSALSLEQEIALGDEYAPEFLAAYGGEVRSPEIRQYVRNIGLDMALASERGDELEWEFFVMDSEVINAFALPGGKIFVSRALIERMQSESELAGVLGHEIGHVTGEHMGKRMWQAQMSQILVIGLGVAGELSDSDLLRGVAIGSALSSPLFLLQHSRAHESDADARGLHYMVQAGYDPQGMVSLMNILKEAGGGRSQFDLFATHPNPDKRIEDLNKLIQKDYASLVASGEGVVGAQPFQQNVVAHLGELGPYAHTLENAEEDVEALQALHGQLSLHEEGCGNCHSLAMSDRAWSATLLLRRAG